MSDKTEEKLVEVSGKDKSQDKLSASILEVAEAENEARRIIERADEEKARVISHAKKKAAQILEEVDVKAAARRDEILDEARKRAGKEAEAELDKTQAKTGEWRKKPVKAIAAKLAASILPE
jgi:vacuolar-type H+-ATPase subunit H